MDRLEFEHLIRAAATIVREEDIVVIGSQAILGPMPNAPKELLRSIEADLFPKANPEKAIEIDGNLGDGSIFHQTYGYYAHGVGPETAVAPEGWEDRLIVVEVLGRIGTDDVFRAHCIEPHDLVLAKCVANRDRDWDFARNAIITEVVDLRVLLDRIPSLPVSDSVRTSIQARLISLCES